MIERVSRYYDGPLAQPTHKYTGEPTIAVFRAFPESISASYSEYVWKEGDTLGAFAEKYLGGSKYWWEIMEINHEITDPFGILPGTVIRVPRGR